MAAHTLLLWLTPIWMAGGLMLIVTKHISVPVYVGGLVSLAFFYGVLRPDTLF